MFRRLHKFNPLDGFLFLIVLIFLQGAVFAESVTLQWDPNSEADLAGYNLYRSSSSGFGYSKVNSGLIPSTSYTDNSVAVGATYYYVCTAVNTSGLESGYSNEVSYSAGPSNTPPVAINDSASTPQNTSVMVNVLSNDQDADGDPLQVTAVTQPAHGSAGFNASTVTYVPAAGYVGNDVFSYTISDGNGGTDTAAVSVVVTFVNHSPTAVDDAATANEDASAYITVTANDSDPDGDSIQVTQAGSAAHGTTTILSSSIVRYTPAANYHGPDGFGYTIADSHGATASATVSVTVNSVNDSPVAQNDSASTIDQAAVTVSVLANDSDVDGDTLSVTSVTQPSHGSSVVSGSTSVRYTPQVGYEGSDSFTYIVGDGHGGSATGTVTVAVTKTSNSAPTAAGDNASVQEDGSVLVNVTANDSDPDGDALSVTLVGSPAHGTAKVASASSVRYTPAANYHGPDSFTYTISDGNGGTATAGVSVTVASVNDAPTAHNDSATTSEDQPVTVSVLANDEDVDGDTLQVTSVGHPSHGTAVADAGGSVTYTPAAGYHGPDSFSYAINDGHGGTSSATVSVTVNSVNDPPTAVADSVTIQEDTSASIQVLANDSDPDGDTLTLVSVTTPQHGTAVIQSGAIRYTSLADYHGSDAFSYTISDGHGATATGNVSVTVSSVNDPPVAGDDDVTTSEEQTVTVAVLANDSDADGDTLSVLNLGTPSHGTVVLNANQTVTYTPAANDQGSDSFGYTVSDGHGGSDGAVVTVTVTAVSDAPQANDDLATTPEDTAAIVPVLANDTDPDGDTLTVASVTQPSHGTAALEGTSAVRYTPAANYHGSDSFIYTVSDGSQTDMASVLITVNSVNDTPVAQNDTASTEGNQAVSIAVLANDSDVDGDVLTVTSLTQPSHGSATIVGGATVTYTPQSGFSGPDTFSYTIQDGQGGTAGATVTVNVNFVNRPPVAVDDSVSTPEDQELIFNPLANDSDPDEDALSITSVGSASHGTVSVQSATSVRYAPAANYHGPDSFSYTVADTHGGTATGQVTLTVTSVNDAPTAVNDAAATGVGEAVSIPVLANDSDPDGDTLTVTSVGNAPHGDVAILSGQTLTYTPKPNFQGGTDTFTYTISDGQGGTATASVTVTVNTRQNTAPAAAADAATTPEDQSVTIAVLANDSDPDSDTLRVETVTEPAHGTAVIQNATTVLYSPAANYFGKDSFSYVVADGQGGTAEATVDVTVTAVNDAPVPVDDQVSVAGNGSVLVPVLANDTDPDGDTLNVAVVGSPLHGQTALEDSDMIRYTPAEGYVGTDSFTYQVSDGQVTRNAQVTVQVILSSQQATPLIFPASVDTGASSYFSNTYVGVGLFNPGASYEYVSVKSHNQNGGQLAQQRLSSPLPPKGQMAFQTGELSMLTPDSISLSVAADSGRLQGFFMVGDYNSRRLDGVGAKLDVADSLYFPMVHEGPTESTLIQMINPSESVAQLVLQLRGRDGHLVDQVTALVAPGGSFMGTAKEIFGADGSVGEGYVHVSADTPVCGYEVVASQKNLSAASGRRAVSASRLVAPHFFVDSDGGNSVLRVLNAGAQPDEATVRVYDESGGVLAEKVIALPVGQLQLVPAAEIFGLGNHKPASIVSGSVELEIAEPTPVVASVDFSGFAGKSATSVPMVEDGYTETIFPQVAQTADGSIFTGLAVLNPSSEAVSVTVEAYSEDGLLVAVRDFDLAPHSRKVDLLNSVPLFGPDFNQIKGHLRVRSTGKVASYAIFGDARGEFLSTIEGQQDVQ